MTRPHVEMYSVPSLILIVRLGRAEPLCNVKTVKWTDTTRERERQRNIVTWWKTHKKRFEVDAIICYSKASFSRVGGATGLMTSGESMAFN